MSEDQLGEGREAQEKLETSLNNYKHKYSQAHNQVTHLEGTVRTLQEKLSDSRSRVSGGSRRSLTLFDSIHIYASSYSENCGIPELSIGGQFHKAMSDLSQKLKTAL